jgi:hypothetical protein
LLVRLAFPEGGISYHVKLSTALQYFDRSRLPSSDVRLTALLIDSIPKENKRDTVLTDRTEVEDERGVIQIHRLIMTGVFSLDLAAPELAFPETGINEISQDGSRMNLPQLILQPERP